MRADFRTQDFEGLVGSAEGRKKILVVEPDAAVLQSLCSGLHARGYKVFAARNTREGIKALCVEKPDLMVLDLAFPEPEAHGGGVNWDGFLLISWPDHSGRSQVPFVAVSKDASAHSRDQSLAAGALGFFPQTIDGDSLCSAVDRALALTTPTV